jgi:hypothetical protein
MSDRVIAWSWNQPNQVNTVLIPLLGEVPQFFLIQNTCIMSSLVVNVDDAASNGQKQIVFI